MYCALYICGTLLLNSFLMHSTEPQKTIYLEQHTLDNTTHAKAILKVVETADDFVIHITHHPYFFHNTKDVNYIITTDGWGVIITGARFKGELANFNLPLPAALSLGRKKMKPHNLTEDTIEITIPKDKTRSRLYYWWHRKKFQRSDPWGF